MIIKIPVLINVSCILESVYFFTVSYKLFILLFIERYRSVYDTEVDLFILFLYFYVSYLVDKLNCGFKISFILWKTFLIDFGHNFSRKCVGLFFFSSFNHYWSNFYKHFVISQFSESSMYICCVIVGITSC